jgi:hypothetical protein
MGDGSEYGSLIDEIEATSVPERKECKALRFFYLKIQRIWASHLIRCLIYYKFSHLIMTENSKIVGMRLSLLVLTMLALPVYAAGNATAERFRDTA